MKSFNINYPVKVKLTKFGKELHKKLWEAVKLADKTLDIWAGDNLKQMKPKLEDELK